MRTPDYQRTMGQEAERWAIVGRMPTLQEHFGRIDIYRLDMQVFTCIS